MLFRYPILAIDYGTKHVGLALYLPKIDSISPLQSLKNTKLLYKELMEIIEQYNVKLVLIGHPSNQELQDKISQFVPNLQKMSPNLKIKFINEDNSSKYTKDMIRYTMNLDLNINKITSNKKLKTAKQTGQFDALSAIIILEKFLKCT